MDNHKHNSISTITTPYLDEEVLELQELPQKEKFLTQKTESISPISDFEWNPDTEEFTEVEAVVQDEVVDVVEEELEEHQCSCQENELWEEEIVDQEFEFQEVYEEFDQEFLDDEYAEEIEMDDELSSAITFEADENFITSEIDELEAETEAISWDEEYEEENEYELEESEYKSESWQEETEEPFYESHVSETQWQEEDELITSEIEDDIMYAEEFETTYDLIDDEYEELGETTEEFFVENSETIQDYHITDTEEIGIYDEETNLEEDETLWEEKNELNEWETLEDDEESLEEDFMGFGFGFPTKPLVSKITFPSEVSLVTVSGPESKGQEFYDPNNSGNPLLDTSSKNRRKKLSKNFSVYELARAQKGRFKFYKARIDPELVECLQNLRKFLYYKPVVVIDGYYSYTYLKKIIGTRRAATSKSPHLSGQGAKISVKGMSGVELAKAIVIACGKYVSISVGIATAAIYVKQPEVKITSYIGNKRKRRAARSSIKQFRELIHNNPSLLKEELQEAYEKLKRSIVETRMRPYGNDIVIPWKNLKKAALYLRQELQVDDPKLLKEILFYTDVVKVIRYNAAFDLLKGTKIGGPYWNFCKGTKGYHCKYEKDDWLEHHLFKSFDRDTLVWSVLENEVIVPVFGRSAPPVSQKGPLDKGSKGERILSEPNPDLPSTYITGKYEAIFSTKGNKKYLGATLCINQAGTHIEGILSFVYAPGGYHWKLREPIPVHGDLQTNGSFNVFFRNSKGNWDITLQSRGNDLIWNLKNHDKGTNDKIIFKPTNKIPVLLSHGIMAFPAKVRTRVQANEWFPLLSIQKKRLKEFLEPGFFTYKDNIVDFEKLLKKALETGRRSYEKSNQRQAAIKFDSLVRKMFNNNGIHRSDAERARFFINSYLVQKKIKVDGRRKQSLLDWVQFLIESLEQNNYFNYNSDFRNVHTYLGLKPLKRKFGAKKHRYKIDINIKGASFIFGAYHGSITIEKLKGTGRTWKEKFKVTFGSGGVSLTEFKKAITLDFTKSITAVSESYLEWQPHDFPGWIKIGEGSASLGPLGTGAGFIHIDGADYIPMMEALFVEKPKLKDLISGDIDLSGGNPKLKLDSPYKNPKKIDVGFGGLVGRIHKKRLPDIDFSEIRVQKTFLGNYFYEKKVHFALGSALLTDPARQAVRIMCAQELALLTNPATAIEITAHTDRVDTHKRNLTLSALRAANTQQAIEDILGTRLQARFTEVQGKGETEAAKVDRDKKENPYFRRVDVFLNSRLVLRLSAL